MTVHYIADDLGYPRDRVTRPGEIPSRATWDAYARELIEGRLLDRLHAEQIMDEHDQ